MKKKKAFLKLNQYKSNDVCFCIELKCFYLMLFSIYHEESQTRACERNKKKKMRERERAILRDKKRKREKVFENEESTDKIDRFI